MFPTFFQMKLLFFTLLLSLLFSWVFAVLFTSDNIFKAISVFEITILGKEKCLCLMFYLIYSIGWMIETFLKFLSEEG